jgi:ribosomal-protein-serine acetyltransferase
MGARVIRMLRLPEFILSDPDLTIRRWLVDDADALAAAIHDSLNELRQWLPWVVGEPLDIRERRALVTQWGHTWEAGGSVMLGAFMGDRVVGASGMHRRIGPGGLEFGYWVRSGLTGQGLATRIALAVTDAAFQLPDVDHVEIHHDEANRASARIAGKLNFVLVDRVPRTPAAPGDTGTQFIWRLGREAWTQRSPVRTTEPHRTALAHQEPPHARVHPQHADIVP